MVCHRAGASRFVSTIAVDRYLFDGGWPAICGARGVCRFFPIALSPDSVSILSIPHFRTPALMPCAYPHTKIRFVLIFSCTCSLALYLCSLSQEYIDARRPRRKAVNGSRHRISSPSTGAFASCASREVGEARRTHQSMRPWHMPASEVASCSLPHRYPSS